MKIKKTKCDHCGKENENTDTTVELREITAIRRPQIQREDADLPNDSFALSTWDFCDGHCALVWLRSRDGNIPTGS